MAFDGARRASFFAQLARIIKVFQGVTIPEGVSGFGGVTFGDVTGTIANTTGVVRIGGPFASCKEFLRVIIVWQLTQSDTASWLKGWRDGEDASATDGKKQLRERIEDFIDGGLDEFLAQVPKQKLSIAHRDFS